MAMGKGKTGYEKKDLFAIDIKKEFLRIDEVREILPVSRSVVYDLISGGKLTTVRPNGPNKKPVFVLGDSLIAYIESITVFKKVGEKEKEE